MPKYQHRYIKRLLKEKNWDRVLFRQKITAACIQNGLPLPSDVSIERWRTGKTEPQIAYLDIICQLLETKREMFYA